MRLDNTPQRLIARIASIGRIEIEPIIGSVDKQKVKKQTDLGNLANNVTCLCSFFVLIKFVLNSFTFVQGLKAIRLDY